MMLPIVLPLFPKNNTPSPGVLGLSFLLLTLLKRTVASQRKELCLNQLIVVRIVPLPVMSLDNSLDWSTLGTQVLTIFRFRVYINCYLTIADLGKHKTAARHKFCMVDVAVIMPSHVHIDCVRN